MSDDTKGERDAHDLQFWAHIGISTVVMCLIPPWFDPPFRSILSVIFGAINVGVLSWAISHFRRRASMVEFAGLMFGLTFSTMGLCHGAISWGISIGNPSWIEICDQGRASTQGDDHGDP